MKKMSESTRSNYRPPQSGDELINRFRNGERYFGETDLDETLDFRDACLEGIVFAPHSFLVADFRNAKKRGADFSDCNIKTCDFRKADLEGARFRNTAIDGTQFGGAELSGT